ncbi:hypothetical protein LG634_01670 [Streptomyces bambusae]|uniref:hypothetical protein n=1 Tax=Streptomyces bambusae TaxID=1550616 RepID=UPI001CFE24EB|nr:hypothetical protein [Streptomyces bambusae]MCB5163558.1 hypothetical protein [Streptomyces bambusae]
MTEFLLGILGSLAASAILLVLGLLRGARPLWWLLATCSRYTGTGLGRVYRHQSSSERDLARDLRRARWVKVLAGRGNVLTREVFSPLWSAGASPQSVQILLPDPDPDPREDSWLDRRSEEVARFDPGFAVGVLRSQVRTNIDYLARVTQARDDIELRTFNLPNNCRVIATDRAAYLTYYSASAHGRNSPCLYARAPGFLYTAALRQFDATWTHATPPLPTPLT